MRKVFLILVAAFLLHGFIVESQQEPTNSLTFDVADSRSIIYCDISRDLALRAVKEEMGWSVQIARKPISEDSSWNLLYHSSNWHGPHPSEVYAWHVVDRYFQNERMLAVRDHPYEVRIVLVNPRVEGQGSQSRFRSGTIRIFWRRKR